VSAASAQATEDEDFRKAGDIRLLELVANMARKRTPASDTPAEKIEALVRTAVEVAKKAKRHRQNLAGDTFYGNKLAELRADAANLFRDLASSSAGDVTAAAELIEAVFSAATPTKDRSIAARELTFSLRTTYRQHATPASPTVSPGYFPQSILVQTNRSYLVTVGRQMNGCYEQGWFDACAVMMRRLLEISIIEAFEANNIASKIKDADDNYVMLSDLVAKSLSEPAWTLSRNAKKHLPQMKNTGHMSAHGRYFHARREDLDKLQDGCRIVVEEFLHHAGLL